MFIRIIITAFLASFSVNTLVANDSSYDSSESSLYGGNISPIHTLKAYRNAFISNDPHEYMVYLSDESIKYLKFLKKSSLSLPAESVVLLSPFQQYFILAARMLLSKEQMVSMDIYEFYKSIDTHVLLLTHPGYKILSMKTNDEHATVKISANNLAKEMITIPFVLEYDQWKINLKDKDLMKVIDDFICWLAGNFGCNVIGLVNMLNHNMGKKFTYEILNPPQGELVSIIQPKTNHLFIGDVDEKQSRSSGVLITPWGFSMRGTFKNWELEDGGEIYYEDGGYIHNASVDFKNDIMKGHYVLSDEEEFIGTIKHGHPHGEGKCIYGEVMEKCTYEKGKRMK